MNPTCHERSTKIVCEALTIAPAELELVKLAESERDNTKERESARTSEALPPHACGQMQTHLSLSAATAYSLAWNNRVQRVMEDAATHTAMQPLLLLSADTASLLSWAAQATMELDDDDCLLRPSHFAAVSQTLAHDTRAASIKGLSVVELSILAAVRRLVALGSERVTTQDIYTHYAQFLKAHPGAAPSGSVLDLHLTLGTGSGGALQVLCMHAVERLMRLELLVWVDKKILGGPPKDHRPVRLALCPYQLLEIFEKEIELPSVISSWATQRLVNCQKSF